MTDNEENLLGMYAELMDGFENMINDGRLTELDVPDDFQWLSEKLAALRVLRGEVEAYED